MLLEEYYYRVNLNSYPNIHYCDINKSKDVDRKTPLINVCIKGYTNIVTKLLEYGATTTNMDFSEKTALMYAIEYNHTDIIKKLVSYKPPLSPD